LASIAIALMPASVRFAVDTPLSASIT
jgi:hypothetical protein